MTRTTLVTIAVTGPVDDLDRQWLWEVDTGEDSRVGTSLTDADAWAAARAAATTLTRRLETAGNALHDAIGGDQ